MKSLKGYFSTVAGILSLCLALLLHANLALSQSSSVTIFGPKKYDIPNRKSVTYTDAFQAVSSTVVYTLWVQSGAEGLDEAKNVSVSINGVEIIDSRDLRTANPVSKTISIQSTNTLTVTLKGQGGSYIILRVLCEGCYPSAAGTISPQGGTVTLEGYATVTFPAGAFATSQNVTVSATSSPETQEDFNVTAEGPRLPYEIRINSGYVAPTTSFDVILNVPDSFIVSIPSGYEIQVFVQIHEQLSAPEIYDHFHRFSSVFDSTAKILRTTLPKKAFTNLRQIEDTYEAIVIVGTALK